MNLEQGVPSADRPRNEGAGTFLQNGTSLGELAKSVPSHWEARSSLMAP